MPGVAVGRDSLPRELAAAQAEAANVAAHEDLLLRRELVAQTKANHRIDPLHHVGSCNGDTESAVQMERRVIDAGVGRHVESRSYRIVPVTKGKQTIERG